MSHSFEVLDSTIAEGTPLSGNERTAGIQSGPAQHRKDDMKTFWTWLRSNPYFVTATSAAGGAIFNALYQEVQTGKVDWSLHGWESIVASAAGVAVVAVYHLYTHTPTAAAAIAAGTAGTLNTAPETKA